MHMPLNDVQSSVFIVTCLQDTEYTNTIEFLSYNNMPF